MILNKFRSGLVIALSLPLLIFSLFSCNKTANSNTHQSFIAFSHVAYGVGALNLSLRGKTLQSTPISLGQTSGMQGNPYDTATTTGIQDLNVYLQQDLSSLANGNVFFQQGARYSMFLYDSLFNGRLLLIIFQDNQTGGADSNAFVRYLNFSPHTTLLLKLTNKKDTVMIGPGSFVGDNPAPSNYFFTRLVSGNYGAYVFSDSTHFKQVDSLRIDSTKIYNVYLQGFIDSTSGPDSLALKSIRLN